MPRNNSEQERMKQLLLSKGVFNNLYKSIKEDLPPSFRAASNAKYSEKDILRYLVMMCARTTSHEGISDIMKDEANSMPAPADAAAGRPRRAAPDGKTAAPPIPTGACLLKRMGGSTYDETLSSCNKMLRESLKMSSVRRMFAKPVVTASDEHDVAAHMKKAIGRIMTNGKAKGGTHKMIRYTTISAVGQTARFTVAAEPTGKRRKKASVAGKLLARMRREGVRSKLHLMDRGFFSTDVIGTMDRMGQTFCMPAVKNSKVVKMIEERAAGSGKAVTKYTISGKKGKAAVTLVIVPNKKAKRDAPAKDRYLAFITNAHHTEARTLVDTLPLKYKERWGIETGYRCAKSIRPRTCSRNPCIRILHFYFTMILSNVWTLSNYLASEGATGKGACARPPITLRRMAESFCRICVAMIRGRMRPEPFLADGIT